MSKKRRRQQWLLEQKTLQLQALSPHTKKLNTKELFQKWQPVFQKRIAEERKYFNTLKKVLDECEDLTPLFFHSKLLSCYLKNKEEIDPLIFQLIEVSVNQGFYYDKWDVDREGYLGQWRDTARWVGERLNKIGGFDLMYSISDIVPSYDRKSLEFAWDGIGTWRA